MRLRQRLKQSLTMTDLRSLRKQAGLTQEEAAKMVFLTRSSWADYEGGRTSPSGAVCKLFEILTGPIIEGRKRGGL